MAQDAETGRISLERDNGFAWLTIGNPARHNAINTLMWRQIAELCREAARDSTIRAVILTGSGPRAFSAGADISEFSGARQGEAARQYDALNDRAFNAVAAIPKPVIAVIQGYCIGGGLALALNCDIRIAAEGAQFSLPPAKLGLGYHPKWIGRLVRTIGPAKAKELIFTGSRFGHDGALRLGLVNRVYPAEGFADAARELAQTIADNAPLSLYAAKASIDAFAAGEGENRLDELSALTDRCYQSKDYEEGQRAFAEKRLPQFKGY